jgi:predicted transcriptional regulator
MTATVRLDDKLEHRLNKIAQMLHKKKSEVIREAIEQYRKSKKL